jgi:hypothetical protein
MKKVIAILLVMGLIFGVTYITMFTGSDVESGKKAVTFPLVFPHEEVHRDATSDDPHFRYFQGFFEKGAENATYFWFRNEEPVEVTFGFRGVSCSTCTSVRAAVVPPTAVDEFAVRSALPVLPIGFGGVPTLVPTFAAVDLIQQLTWTDFGVNRTDLELKVPPAVGDRPTWGVVRFGFKAHVLGPWDPTAGFYAQAAGAANPHEYRLQVHFVGMEGYDVTPSSFGITDLPEGAPPANVSIYYWSVIRPQSDLPPPAVSVKDNDPFVVVGPPVPLTDADLDKVAAQIGPQRQEANLKIRSGYRIPVSIRREAPGKLPDIGAYEKTVHVVGPGERVFNVSLKGRVTGLVWLQDMLKIDLKHYNAKYGTEIAATLVSGRPDLDLAVVPDETKPRFLQAKLAEPKAEPGRKTWVLTVTVPPNEGFEPNWEGAVVLTTTGPTPQKVRVPVIGSGR